MPLLNTKRETEKSQTCESHILCGLQQYFKCLT